MSQDTSNWKAKVEAAGFEIGESLSARQEINRNSEKVWKAISSPGHLANVHPFCRETTVGKWPGMGAHDSITYYSGRKYRRDFVGWIEGVGYDIEVGAFPNVTSRVQWRVLAASPVSSAISIEVFPFIKVGTEESKRELYLSRLFGADFQHYLDCVVKGVKYYSETGKAVDEDQFGSNKLYSNPDNLRIE